MVFFNIFDDPEKKTKKEKRDQDLQFFLGFMFIIIAISNLGVLTNFWSLLGFLGVILIIIAAWDSGYVDIVKKKLK